MNVEELLSYQPSKSVDGPEASTSYDGDSPSTKRQKLDRVNWDQMKDAPAPLDEITLKRILVNLEKKIHRNQELRVKFADNPSKFMDSECELFDCLQELHPLSTQPELYSLVIEMKMIPLLVGLLSHENTDISISVISLFDELTDTDDSEERESVTSMITALLNEQLILHLVSQLDRLNESIEEESTGIFNILSIMENILEVEEDKSDSFQRLIKWIIKRFQNKSITFNQNKLYSSEILAILLQLNANNRKYLGDLDGIDVLLQQLAQYKKKETTSNDEKEFIGNVYDCLCSCLTESNETRHLFLKAEGIELMNLILKDCKSSCLKQGALKVLSFVLSPHLTDQVTSSPSTDSNTIESNILRETCNKFVDLRPGVRCILPIFMKPKSILSGLKKRELESTINTIEEHSLNIICSLLRFCSEEQVKRTTVKFVECEFEKTERLIELHTKYSLQLEKWEKKERQRMIEYDEEIDDEEMYVKKISQGGLYTLQLIYQVLLMAASYYQIYFATDHPERETIYQRINKLLKMHTTSTSIQHYQYINKVMNDLIDETTLQSEKQRFTSLLNQFNENTSHSIDKHTVS